MPFARHVRCRATGEVVPETGPDISACLECGAGAKPLRQWTSFAVPLSDIVNVQNWPAAPAVVEGGGPPRAKAGRRRPFGYSSTNRDAQLHQACPFAVGVCNHRGEGRGWQQAVGSRGERRRNSSRHAPSHL